ncbi:MAG: S41 family peptidase [Anaerolineae bacterium]|jgi:C-terminal processing protease CtpA/Prc|nr:S41 family peptidase [Anaerolineae bacterium]
MTFKKALRAGLMLLLPVLTISSVMAIGEDENPPTTAGQANIINDEGGLVQITGTVSYTNPFFTLGTAQPLVILEDQAGFVDRNQFYLIPPESQVLGQITSDFLVSPFNYSLSLPIEPQGGLRDVDNDGQTDSGVMVFAVAYWSNTFGDPFLEKRDLYGGGWSTAYASTRVSSDPDLLREIIGGSFVIYAPDDQQGFPAGFGADGLLFTADDPIVSIPAGYTVVNLDTDPFTFDRSRNQVIDLIEPEGAAVSDFSSQSYTAAFDAMVDKMSREYAFTEYKGIDWQALRDEYRGRFVAAETTGDVQAYALALRDFLWEIPDGHVSMSLNLLNDLFQEETAGGFGFAMRQLDDGRVIVNFITPGTPAEAAGMTLGTEIIAMDGQPIEQVLSGTFVWAHQVLGSESGTRLQQLRYATRRPLGTAVDITYRNPGGSEQTATLTTVNERDSWRFSSFSAGLSGTELPVEFDILPSGYGYVAIYSFSDNDLLSIQLWERMLRTFIDGQVPGIIVDMRSNGGGSGFLADQMSAYFFNDSPIYVGQTGYYNEELGDFFFDERGQEELFLPPEELRYTGPVAVLVGPNCASACEFFSYNMTINDRADIVGMYPTGGLGGSVEDFYMPEDVTVRFTIGRAVDMNGNIHIEGIGVQPTVLVPVTEETLFAEGDVILEYGVQALTQRIQGTLIDGGTLTMGTPPAAVAVNGVIEPDTGVRYTVTFNAGTVISLFAGSEDGTLDTVLNIYDATGTELLASNDDDEAGGTLNSALEGIEIDEEITVVVEVRLLEGTPGGAFFLRIEAQPAGAQ